MVVRVYGEVSLLKSWMIRETHLTPELEFPLATLSEVGSVPRN